MIVLAGPMKLAQRSLETLDLPFVVDLLALGKFQRFEHFLHLFERMFQFLDHSVDLINGFGNCRFLVLLGRLRMMPSFAMLNALLPLGAFASFGAVAAIHLLRVLTMFGVLLSRVLHRFRGAFIRRFHAFGVHRCGRIAGRGQGTAITAPPGMASASAPGSTPEGGCRIRLFGWALVCFVRRHKDRLPRGS